MSVFVDVKVYQNENNDIIKVRCAHHHSNGEVKTFNIVEGMRVKVVPLNPLKKRNRDRIGTVTGFTTQYRDPRAKVQFDDTKGVGKIEFEELVKI